ncbi:4Fe-4S binding protein [Candidatus Bathyarchaeota archaeon]|nr:4Fe-4S binding protein [Candidatus Bathyarchaeota archaeon]
MNVWVGINHDLCTGCKACVKSCIFGVLEWLNDTPLVSNPYRCSYCLECQRNCGGDAIKIEIA